jgi:hypothetical protein
MEKREFLELLEECAGRNGWHAHRPAGYDPYGQGAVLVVSSHGCHQREYTLVDLDRDVLRPYKEEITQAGLSCVLRFDDAGHYVLRVFEITDNSPRHCPSYDDIEMRPIE